MDKLKTIQIIKTFSRNIHIMVASEALSALAMGIFFFLQVLYYDFIGLSAEAIGTIFSIGSLFTLIGFFMGPFIKIFGRKRILCIGLSVCAIGIGFHMGFKSMIVLIIGQILINLGTCLIHVTELQLLYSYTTGQKECCAYSYKYSVNLIAGAVGALIAGNITGIEYFAKIGYKKLFLLAAIILIVTSSIRCFLLPKDATNAVENEEVKKSMRESIKCIKSDKQIRLFSMLLFINTLGFSGVGPYNNLILKNYFNLENNIISYITFSLTILSMVGLILMPRLIEKIGVKKFNLTIFVIAIVSCFILAMVSNSELFIFFLVIRGVFVGLIISSLDSLMMSNIAIDHRDIFAAVKMLSNGFSISIGNFVGGTILNNLGYRYNYLYGFVMLLCATLFFYLRVRSYMANTIINRSCPCHFKVKHIEYKR
ncbi:MFS transporter [Clostridium subterminale]|uniref:MFS transporter n=1 Tax=Clostridium subterminale TaxID=1550 RepID=A0ABP3W3B1_CLOSU